MPITLPREERFKQPSPMRADVAHLEDLRTFDHRNNVLALAIQMKTHALMTNPNYYRDLRRWPRANIQRIRGMAFDGYYPLPEDFENLEKSLKGKSGHVHTAVRQFRQEVEAMIRDEEQYWFSTRWHTDPEALHEQQDTEAVRTIINTLGGRIAFFGSARLEGGSPEYESARWLSRVLVEHLPMGDGRTEEVVTGGGPGIMDAGNRGALEGSWNLIQRMQAQWERGNGQRDAIEKRMQQHRERMQSIGVRIELPFETGWNPHLHLNFSIDSFPDRKKALCYVATGRRNKNGKQADWQGRHPGFFVFNGGIGTKDELWEIVCHQQCGTMTPIPIIVVGDEETRMVDHNLNTMLEAGTVSPRDLKIITTCTNEKEALLKYLEWHKIEPPAALMEEIRRHEPIIKNKRETPLTNSDGHAEKRIIVPKS